MVNAFKNPVNGYVEIIHPRTWFYCLMFGPIYFGYKGIWTHVFISFVLIPITFGMAWFAYPLFAYSIIKKSYLQKGWIEIKTQNLNDIPPITQELSIATLLSVLYPVLIGFLLDLAGVENYSFALNWAAIVCRLALALWWFQSLRKSVRYESSKSICAVSVIAFLFTTVIYEVVFLSLNFVLKDFNAFLLSNYESFMNFALLNYVLLIVIAVFMIFISFKRYNVNSDYVSDMGLDV